MNDIHLQPTSFTYSLFLEDVSSELQSKRRMSEQIDTSPPREVNNKGRERSGSYLYEYKEGAFGTPSTVGGELEEGKERDGFSLRRFSLKSSDFVSNFGIYGLLGRLEEKEEEEEGDVDLKRAKEKFEGNLIGELLNLLN